jgi:hypothetical protein
MGENHLFFSKELAESMEFIFSKGNNIIVPGITFDAGVGMVFSCRGTDPSVLHAYIGNPKDSELEELEEFTEFRNEKGDLKNISNQGKVFVEKETLDMIDGEMYEKIQLVIFSQEEGKIILMAKLQ